METLVIILASTLEITLHLQEYLLDKNDSIIAANFSAVSRHHCTRIVESLSMISPPMRPPCRTHSNSKNSKERLKCQK